MSIELLPSPSPTIDVPNGEPLSENSPFVEERAISNGTLTDSLDRKGFEFVEGQWLEKNVSAEADMIGMNLVGRLHIHLDTQRVGLVFGPECGYQIFPDDPRRVRKPDVSFIKLGRLPDDHPPRSNIRIAPDFAAEIISPSDEAEEINVKVQQYLRAGIRLVWVVYPKTRSVWVFRSDGSATWIINTGELKGEEAIPGFVLPLEKLFANLK